MYKKLHINTISVFVALAVCFQFSTALNEKGFERMELLRALHPHHDAAPQKQGGTIRTSLEKNLTLLSFMSFPPSTLSDVWAHKNTAYVAGLGSPFFKHPVRIIDISDPENPSLLTTLPAMGQGNVSSPQDVKAAGINTNYFNGDLLVVGHDGPGGGIQLWDVSDPANPLLLSELQLPFVHNAYIYQKGNRAFVLLAIPFEERFPSSIGADFAIVEVTDPTQPFVISSWTAGRDGGFPYGFGSTCDPSVCRGNLPFVICHDVWANQNGTIAYLSYWDLGLILLDISDPTNPTLIGRGIEPPTFGSDEGNSHNAVPAQGGNLVIVTDEDFAPFPAGFLRIFDTSDPGNPFQIGAYATDGTLNNPSGDHGAHNVIVRGSRAYLSWYREGIRVVDISQPANPREIAAFVPPPGTSPGFFWGVYVHKDLILGSDEEGGLFILKQEATGELNKKATENSDSDVPVTYSLEANHPNPFNPETTIEFQLPEATQVTLKIYNAIGQEVRTLVNSVYQQGSHQVIWDGKNADGIQVPSGLYLYQLQAGSFVQTKKMILMK
jgi:hypothetical protein